MHFFEQTYFCAFFFFSSFKKVAQACFYYFISSILQHLIESMPKCHVSKCVIVQSTIS